MHAPDGRLQACEARLVVLWERLVRLLGIHTVNVLMERAIWEIAPRHDVVALIGHSDSGLRFEDVNLRYADAPGADIEQAFGDLTTEMLMILARLLGQQIAEQLGQELAALAGQPPHSVEPEE